MFFIHTYQNCDKISPVKCDHLSATTTRLKISAHFAPSNKSEQADSLYVFVLADAGGTFFVEVLSACTRSELETPDQLGSVLFG